MTKVAGAVLLLLLAGCSIDGVGAAPASVAPAQPLQVALGSVIPITEFGAPILNVTVLNGITYTGATFIQPAAGDTYYLLQVKYEGVGSGGTYSPYDWSAYVDNQKLALATVIDPQYPTLSLGTIAAGRSITGWVAFEGPSDASAVEFDYTLNPYLSPNPIFEVVLQKRPTG